MTYDESSFLAGLAAGRQLKGWGAGGSSRGVGFCYTATGGRELVNRQGADEYNSIQLPAGVRYCTMYVPGGYMYVFAAATEPFTLRVFSNDTEEPPNASGRIALGGQSYYYAYDYWYDPLPSPLVECIAPVRGVNAASLTADQVVTQGMLYLYGDR